MPTLTGSRDVAPGPNHVVFTSDLPLRTRRHAVSFLRDAFAIRRVLDATLRDPAGGLIRYELRAHPLANRYSTESVWDSQVSLRRFASHPVHAEIMRRQARHLGAATFSVQPLPPVDP